MEWSEEKSREGVWEDEETYFAQLQSRSATVSMKEL